MKGRGQGATRILTHKALKPFLGGDLTLAIQKPIEMKTLGNKRATGYEATIINDLCEVVLKARDAALLKTEQEWRYGQCAESLVRVLAKVGIIALVDEATGYQADRERDELHRFLELYLSEERLKWARMFPDDFFRNIYRLKRWPYPGGNKRPPFIGKIINKIVYEKLPDGVLKKLRELNPVRETTRRRRWKHHQFFSVNIGQPDLKNHIIQLMALERAASNWKVFERLVERAFPGPGPRQTEMEEFIDV
jgi:hypothetical protein